VEPIWRASTLGARTTRVMYRAGFANDAFFARMIGRYTAPIGGCCNPSPRTSPAMPTTGKNGSRPLMLTPRALASGSSSGQQWAVRDHVRASRTTAQRQRLSGANRFNAGQPRNALLEVAPERLDLHVRLILRGRQQHVEGMDARGIEPGTHTPKSREALEHQT